MAFTFFFRDGHLLELAVDHVAPELAGRLGPFAFRNLRIDATDLDETGQFEYLVRQAAYPGRDLERMPPGILDQYFEPAGENGSYRVVAPIRASVRFQRHDLLSLQAGDPPRPTVPESGGGIVLVVIPFRILRVLDMRAIAIEVQHPAAIARQGEELSS